MGYVFLIDIGLDGIINFVLGMEVKDERYMRLKYAKKEVKQPYTRKDSIGVSALKLKNKLLESLLHT